MHQFEPTIIGFLCHWCSYEAADSAGRSGKAYPPNLKVIRVMCSGRIDPQFVIRAFNNGTDGVIILGCHPGECHYKEGNHHAYKRYILLKKMLVQLGLEQARLRLDWVSASEGDKLIRLASEMVGELKKLGSLRHHEASNLRGKS